MKRYFVILFLYSISFSYSQNSVKAMFYNLYRFPTNPPANREFILKNILSEYHPDLLMVCELDSEDGAKRILNTAIQTPQNNFARAVFEPIRSVLNPKQDEKLQQTVFYNTDKLILINQAVLLTNVRDINHYTFKLNTTISETDPIYLEVFISHLKSSQGPANRTARLDMVNTFLSALETIPKEHYTLFAGDFNFYNSDKEPGYQKLIDTANPIIMVDPINQPGTWHNNILFSKIHTQATRTLSTGFGSGGATGGLDDRFDFIMMSENFHTSIDFYYVDDSYKSFGNNGNCMDQRINHEDCGGLYNLNLRQNLHDMSDHLPVIMEFETTQEFRSSNPVIILPEKTKQPLLSFISGNVEEDHIHLKINADELVTSTNLFFFNILGQKIKTIKINNSSYDLKINIQTLQKGIYYIRLQDQTDITLKFIKK